MYSSTEYASLGCGCLLKVSVCVTLKNSCGGFYKYLRYHKPLTDFGWDPVLVESDPAFHELQL